MMTRGIIVIIIDIKNAIGIKMAAKLLGKQGA